MIKTLSMNMIFERIKDLLDEEVLFNFELNNESKAFANFGQTFAYIENSELKKYIEYTKKGCNDDSIIHYEQYDLPKDKIGAITTNGKFGFSLGLIRSSFKLIRDKTDYIYIPSDIWPSYLKLKDGWSVMIAPMMFEDGADVPEIISLKKKDESLSSFF
jgi:hypothetical protein